jgi:hypothetical protein
MPTDIDLWALAPAEVIGLELGAHAVTSDEAYLARAERFAADAITLFWGERSLPRASTRTDQYETVTGADDLALAILEVYATLSPPAEDGG